MAKILLVDDDKQLAANVKEWLETENHRVEVVHDGLEAISFFKSYSFDLIVLDWNMPKISGLEVIETLRNSGNSTPVLMLTARDELDDKELGLNRGADDYLTKPFHHRELNARVKALLRRSSNQMSNELTLSGLSVDPYAYKVTFGNENVSLLPKEFALLEFFLRNPERIFNCDELLDKVWPSDSEASPNTVRSYVYTLKKKLAGAGFKLPLKSIYGVGYKLQANLLDDIE